MFDCASPQAAFRALSPSSLNSTRTVCRHHRSLDAFSDHDHLPRITTGGLSLAAEQCRIDSATLWQTNASLLVKLCALERLRDRVGLPRWVVISNGLSKPVPFDLESVCAIRTIEQVARTTAHTVFIETVPAPPDFWISDADGEAFCSSITLRLPVDESSEMLAARTARQFVPKRATPK